jgi:hypothetical protein
VSLEALQYRMAKSLNWENLALATTREGWTQVVAQVPGSSLTSFELIPDDLAGKEFIIMKGYFFIPDRYYIYPIADATKIYINGIIFYVFEDVEEIIRHTNRLNCARNVTQSQLF